MSWNPNQIIRSILLGFLCHPANDSMTQEDGTDGLNMSDDFERTGRLKRYADLPRRYTWCSWHQMMRRCYETRCKAYRLYGERGITVVDRWHSFDNFLADVGLRPRDYVISRKNHNENYSPDNALWEHKSLLNERKRNGTAVTINGETRTVSDWARISGIRKETIKYRVKKGWPSDKLLGRGSWATKRDQPDSLLAAIFNGVDLNGEKPTMVLSDELWERVKKFMSEYQYLVL